MKPEILVLKEFFCLIKIVYLENLLSIPSIWSYILILFLLFFLKKKLRKDEKLDQ